MRKVSFGATKRILRVLNFICPTPSPKSISILCWRPSRSQTSFIIRWLPFQTRKPPDQ